MTLSLDISTSITGFAIFDTEKKELVRYGTLDFRNKVTFTSLYKQFSFAKDFFLTIKEPIDRIVVETPLQMFKGGQSSATVISMLQRFNGMVCVAAFDVFKIEPEMAGSTTCRSGIGLKVPRELKKDKAKKYIAEWVSNNVPNFEIKQTKKGNPVPGTFDMADAVVVGLYALKNPHLPEED